MEDLYHLNYLAILVSAIVYMVLGFLWYSPWLFGKHWMDCCKLKEEDLKCCCWTTYLSAFLNALIISLALAALLHKTGVINISDGACVAFWAWLGFVATTLMSGVIWEGKSLYWWLINAGFSLIGLLVIESILVTWK